MIPDFIEPEREVMRQIAWNLTVAYREDSDAKHIEAAERLVQTGWAENIATFPCYGSTYHRYGPGPKARPEHVLKQLKVTL